MMAATALPVEAAAEYAALKARRDATPSGPQRMLVGAQILDHLAPYTDFDGIQSTYLDEDDLFTCDLAALVTGPDGSLGSMTTNGQGPIDEASSAAFMARLPPITFGNIVDGGAAAQLVPELRGRRPESITSLNLDLLLAEVRLIEAAAVASSSESGAGRSVGGMAAAAATAPGRAGGAGAGAAPLAAPLAATATRPLSTQPHRANQGPAASMAASKPSGGLSGVESMVSNAVFRGLAPGGGGGGGHKRPAAAMDVAADSEDGAVGLPRQQVQRRRLDEDGGHDDRPGAGAGAGGGAGAGASAGGKQLPGFETGTAALRHSSGGGPGAAASSSGAGAGAGGGKGVNAPFKPPMRNNNNNSGSEQGGSSGGGGAGKRPVAVSSSGGGSGGSGGGPDGIDMSVPLGPNGHWSILQLYGGKSPQLPLPDHLLNVDLALADNIEKESFHGEMTRFSDIAGLEEVKRTMRQAILLPLYGAHLLAGSKLLETPRGILLFGPPGTGKTMLAKAAASQLNAAFFSISASSITSKWHGESEKQVRALFAVALEHAPSIIFLDEIDSMLTVRKEGDDGSSQKVKTQFLIEMDGANAKRDKTVLIIGATNRPDMLDEAVRRRFTRRILIPLPDKVSRRSVIDLMLAGHQGRVEVPPEARDEIAAATEGYSAADVKLVCNAAAQRALKRSIKRIQRANKAAAAADAAARAAARAALGQAAEAAPAAEADADSATLDAEAAALQQSDITALDPVTADDMRAAAASVKPSVQAEDVARHRAFNEAFGWKGSTDDSDEDSEDDYE